MMLMRYRDARVRVWWAVWMWNASERLGIPLGRLAPALFGLCIGATSEAVGDE